MQDLQDHTEALGRLVTPGHTDDAADRLRAYRKLENAVLDLANAFPGGVEVHDVNQLLIFLTELRRALEADELGRDTDQRLALAFAKFADALRRLARHRVHWAVDEPSQAAAFVLTVLESLTMAEIARLLGVTPKTLTSWKNGAPVKRHPRRVCLVAQVIAYLRAGMTARGIQMWFENPSTQLGGTPLALLDGDIDRAGPALIAYARGGRGQMAG